MSVFALPAFRNHEQVVFCNDAATGLQAIIAIHDTTLGPALGGCRMWSYASDDEAVEDVLRLSRGMTYKSALAGLDWGGGKAVILGDPKTEKTPALFEAFGRFVDHLGGRYITAEDVGVSPSDLEAARRNTRHVVGIAEGGSGDPSPATAWGVFQGIRAAARHKLGKDGFDGVTVALQGLGHVGWHVAKHLHAAGAKLIVTDIDRDRVAQAKTDFGASAVDIDTIYDADADIFAPNALGAVINDDTLPRLKMKVVAGSANNQLAEDRHGQALVERGILYAPDYVINAGGIINIAYEGPNYDKNKAFNHCAGIHDTLLKLFVRADREGVPTNVMADRLAEERLTAARNAAGKRPALREVV